MVGSFFVTCDLVSNSKLRLVQSISSFSIRARQEQNSFAKRSRTNGKVQGVYVRSKNRISTADFFQFAKKVIGEIIAAGNSP